MIVNRTTDRNIIADAYGVHVKDAYELVKMSKKPVHRDLRRLPTNIRELLYDKNHKIIGFSHRFPNVSIDLSQLQPLMNQLVDSERPYDKERFKIFEMDMSPENYQAFMNRKTENTHDLIYLDDTLTKIIGFIRCHFCELDNGEKYLYVYNFVVDKNYRGKGIGKDMLQRAENVAFNSKCKYIVLSVYRVNKAIKLYKSLGFNEIKEYSELWEQ